MSDPKNIGTGVPMQAEAMLRDERIKNSDLRKHINDLQKNIFELNEEDHIDILKIKFKILRFTIYKHKGESLTNEIYSKKIISKKR